MKTYNFNISLSILNHLGRNLYRSFITVVGEAISNSWDADAKEVHITIDRDNQRLVIIDNGDGMNEDDFQNKFLKIGYSKRKENNKFTKNGRPFIGRKGIGKLALLSCAEKITILTKTLQSEIVGGIIDNTGLDKAIKDDVSSNDYNLSVPSEEMIAEYAPKIGDKGTAIIFDGLKDGIRNRVDYIRQLIALYFRFSLKDPSFDIYINEEKVELKELDSIKGKTQFVWKINDINDPYIKDGAFIKTAQLSIDNKSIKGFLATVETPSNLKIRGTDEKITLDLYVNGRLREKDIIRHISTARIVENYLYGQIHFDDLDDDTDRFTSSREGVVPDDPKFKELLDLLEAVLKKVISDWDIWRTELNQDGDADNPRMSKKQRKAKELFNAVADDFKPSSDSAGKRKVNGWIKDISADAEFNFESYGECFVSENLLRYYIRDKSIVIPDKIQHQIDSWKTGAETAKQNANINFEIREDVSDLTYVDMDILTFLADENKDKTKGATLLRDAMEYKPIRDALAHTSRLTKIAKTRLNITYENIKARIIALLDKV